MKPEPYRYRKIVVNRGGARIASIDLYAFLTEGRLKRFQFRDGDTVFVKARGPVVSVSTAYL